MRECLDDGENLIFLVSQPRAGSTLLQNILGNHPAIHTMPETWSMLHSLYALKEEGYKAEYNSDWSRVAMQAFLSSLPTGEKAYYKGVSKMHSYLYQLALEASGKRFFLDKTPRYFHIISELYQAFPKAKFIILIRNPLAVLCSIVSTWIREKESWSYLHHYRLDLIHAPSQLLDAKSYIPASNLFEIRYESLISNPQTKINEICTHFGLNYSPDFIHYNPSQMKGVGYSEQTKDIYQSGKPDAKNLERWVAELKDPQTWRIINDYLELLGKTTIENMGYSYADLRCLVNAHEPPKRSLLEAVPLQWLLEKPEGWQKWQYNFLRLNRSLHKMSLLDVWAKIQASMRDGVLTSHQ